MVQLRKPQIIRRKTFGKPFPRQCLDSVPSEARFMRSITTFWISLLIANVAFSGELKITPTALTLNRNDAACVCLSRWGDGEQMQRLVDAAELQRFFRLSPFGTEKSLQRRGLSFHTNWACFRASGVHQIVAVGKTSGRTEFAKALILVGQNGENRVKRLGLDVEIVPINKPATWRADCRQRFQVFHRGKPLCGQHLSVTNFRRSPEPHWAFSTVTNACGVASVPVRRTGVWVLCVRLPQPMGQSLVATLVLEIRPELGVAAAR